MAVFFIRDKIYFRYSLIADIKTAERCLSVIRGWAVVRGYAVNNHNESRKTSVFKNR